MIIFTGFVACIFFTALAGWSWPTQQNTNLTHALLDNIGKSLWIAWLLVAVGYLGNIPPSIWVWAALIGLLVAALFSNKKKLIGATPWELLGIAAIVIVVALGASKMFIFGSYHYTRIFSEWDPLVSWNRWATELFVNGYAPVGAAYPILFPGIWSLIYRAQGTAEIWFVAKLSLFILPIILLLAALLLAKSGRKISALAALLFCYWFFWRVQKYSLFGGYMDSPVAMLTMVFVMLAVPIVDAIENDRPALSLLTTMAVVAGITSITKQAGFFCLVLFTLFVAILAYNKYLTRKKMMELLAIAAVPFLAFYLMYSWAGQSGVIHNLSYLSGLTATVAADKGIVSNALEKLSDRNGDLVIIALSLISFLNIRRIREIRGQLGIAMLLAAAAGFFIYANCCAYHARNGWWVVSLFAGSALLAVTGFIKAKPSEALMRLYPARLVFAVLVSGTLFSGAVLGFFINDQKAFAIQEKEQWALVPSELSVLLKEKLASMDKEDILISPYQPLGWLPTIHGRYRMCGYNAPDCVKDLIHTAKKSYVLVHTSDQGLRIEGLDSLLNPKSLIDTADGFLLYGPFKE